MRKPVELERAELILGLCERFGCLPSQLMAEDGDMWRLLQTERLGDPQGKNAQHR